MEPGYVFIGVRVPIHFRRQIDAAAALADRSMSQEIRSRLEQSFHDDRIEAALNEIKARLDGRD